MTGTTPDRKPSSNIKPPSTLTERRHASNSHREETRNKRGLQLGILGIHIIVAALEKIHLPAETITLNLGAQAIYKWTRFAAPKQGFNCLAKHNTDVGKELQQWISTTTTPFTDPKNLNPTEHDTDSDSEDDTTLPLSHTHEASTGASPSRILYPPRLSI
jgi:hypothetical protein